MSWVSRALVLVGMLVAAVMGATVLLSRERPPLLAASSPSTTSPTIEPTTTTRAATTVTAAPKPRTTTTVRRVPSTTKAPTTVTTAPPTTAARATATSADDALTLLNRDRTSRGLPALRVRADAQAKAQAWADRLAREGKGLYHSTMSDGLDPCATGIGENIASASSVTQAEQLLMDDPPHRENILASRWNWVGVGVGRTPTGVIVVHVFMSGCL